MKENSIEEDIKKIENYLANSAINDTNSNFFKNGGWETVDLEIPEAMQHILTNYKRVLKENKTYKKQYFGLIDKIENKIDKFDYEFEKAKRKNDNDRADYYWDLIRNFIKILESEE